MPSERAFLRLWAAESISKAGDAVSMVAIPLTAILALDATPIGVGLLGAAQLLPIVALGLPAGAWVDRLRSRRRVMVAADVGRAVVTATVPLAWAMGTLTFGHLLVVVAVNAALGTFFDVAIASYLPMLVGRDRLVVSNSRMELSRSASLVLGPGTAGLVLRFAAPPIVLAMDAASFLASALLITGSPGREAEPATSPTKAGDRGSLRRELLAGVRLALHEPHLRAITATAMTNNLSRSIGMVVAVLVLVREAGVPAEGVGIGFALGNSGFVAGALAASRVSRALGIGRAMRLSVRLFWPGMLLLGLAPAPFALAAFTVMVFMNGFGIAVHNVNQVSVRQAVTPDRMLARVAAAQRLLILGALPAGTLIGGILGTAIGLQNTLLVSAFGLFLGSVPYTVSRVRSLRALPAEAVVS
jgi:MFS family permease